MQLCYQSLVKALCTNAQARHIVVTHVGHQIHLRDLHPTWNGQWHARSGRYIVAQHVAFLSCPV